MPHWRGARNPCCGVWTTDGRYFVFVADGNLWARAEERRMFARGTREPAQLTFGPVRFSGVTPSRDGKHLFATGDLEKGRLARYDITSKQFVEYLAGISAEGAAISNDGRWVTYMAFPEGTLWRSRVDGGERLQLSFPPMVAWLPRWSPDDSQIAFFGGTALENARVYVVPAAGGAPRRATAGTVSEFDPTWSPDGHHLAFGSAAGEFGGTGSTNAIQVLDLTSGQLSTLPGSEGLYSPRWSPDGRYIRRRFRWTLSGWSCSTSRLRNGPTSSLTADTSHGRSGYRIAKSCSIQRAKVTFAESGSRMAASSS